jgi:hypothetical protein
MKICNEVGPGGTDFFEGKFGLKYGSVIFEGFGRNFGDKISMKDDPYITSFLFLHQKSTGCG